VNVPTFQVYPAVLVYPYILPWSLSEFYRSWAARTCHLSLLTSFGLDIMALLSYSKNCGDYVFLFRTPVLCMETPILSKNRRLSRKITAKIRVKKTLWLGKFHN